MKRDLGDHYIEHVDLSEVKRIGYSNAQDIAKGVLSRFEAGEFDVATIFYARFINVVSVPTASKSSQRRLKRPRVMRNAI